MIGPISILFYDKSKNNRRILNPEIFFYSIVLFVLLEC